VLLCM